MSNKTLKPNIFANVASVRFTICLISIFQLVSLAHGQHSILQGERENTDSPLNWELPTLGGQHFWSDVHYWGGWRIQRHSETEHHRLLDPNQIRKAWGSREQCQQTLKGLIQQENIQPEQGTVVILLHGLWRSNDSMEPLGNYLNKQASFTVINLAYASARGKIETHADDLASVIAGLSDQVTEINVVAHSMGNIVFRCYLGQLHRQGLALDPRFKRMVMLAPPNQGSRVARTLSKSLAFQTLAGLGGVQLGAGWPALQPKLATPTFEFGIIAGSADGDKNPSLLKPRDFTVFVNETHLAGATGFHLGPYFHWNIKYHPQAMDETLHFLKTGKFQKPANFISNPPHVRQQ